MNKSNCAVTLPEKFFFPILTFQLRPLIKQIIKNASITLNKQNRKTVTFTYYNQTLQ
jgi:hypothetical protein